MKLTEFPRIRLAHLPTAIEHMPRLSTVLGGPEIWIKRDDCTGLSTGGNKTRKLEFLMAEAQAEGADIVLTQGATQSNHARQTAAAAAKLGMDCHILLEDRTGSNDINYNYNGNVLLDQLHGASKIKRPGGSDLNAELLVIAEKMRTDGRKPYCIPGGGSNTTGALGYVNAALETVYQLNDSGLHIDHFVTATGSAGTQAGLICGLQLMNARLPLLGIGVRAPQPTQEENVHNLATATAERLGIAGGVPRESVVANCDYIGEGYGIPADSTLEAIDLFARTEGILLDPVYSAKGGAGLIDLVRQKHFRKGQNILFLHTGGAIALTGYLNYFQGEA